MAPSTQRILDEPRLWSIIPYEYDKILPMRGQQMKMLPNRHPHVIRERQILDTFLLVQRLIYGLPLSLCVIRNFLYWGVSKRDPSYIYNIHIW